MFQQIFFRYIITSIVLITFGCLVAGIGDLDFDQHAYILGVMCVFAQGGYLTLVQKSSEGKKSTLEMVHINSYNTLPFFIVMSLLFREPALISETAVIHGEWCWFIFCLNVDEGFLQDYELLYNHGKKSKEYFLKNTVMPLKFEGTGTCYCLHPRTASDSDNERIWLISSCSFLLHL